MNIRILLLLTSTLCCANGNPIEKLTSSNNQFSALLYKELLEENQGNLVVSPFSIEVILALSQSGAKNQTAEEIRTSLHLPNSDEEIKDIFKNILQFLKGDTNFTLHTANKIYLKDIFTLNEQFKKTANEIYQADVENIDFSKKIEAANSMNQWVEEQTENKIKNLIDPDILQSNTAAILINTLHFKGTWRKGFSSKKTQKKSFYKTNEDVIQVDMMHDSPLDRRYYNDEELDAEFLEMPFLGEDISMVIALPKKKDGITILESQIEKVFAPHNFQHSYFPVILPKFKIENAIDLKKILKNLGIKKAFLENEADFSGVINENKNLYIDDVKQKAFISVDEKGVEAAAATYQTWRFLSGSSKKFVADHPFIFYIKFKNLILFAGKVSVPEQ